MQNFSDGLPPPPPVSHSWKRVDRWAEDNYHELWSNICEGATPNDINELEHELDCTLPMDVRESIQIHDGQERGGLPTGIIFGCMLLDCEEIVEEWQNWRTVSEEFLTQRSNVRAPQPPSKAFASSSSAPAQPQSPNNPLWRQELLGRQDSQPPNAVQKAYCHPAWIPLARDWGGNYLAVDLAPGPAGKWGQIIIFGRDYDCKYVVARSWGAFLAALADDLSTPKVWIDEDTGELKLRQFKDAEPPYLEVLRWRCDQKYGRKGPKRRPGPNGGLHINPGLGGPAPRGEGSSGSPYASPVEERGRSPHRFSQKTHAGSPRGHVSSPLARVAEEGPQPLKIHTKDLKQEKMLGTPIEKLVSVDTPRPSEDLLMSAKQDFPPPNPISGNNNKGKENEQPPPHANGKEPTEGEHADTAELKTVDI
jgi:cell wall assembly regulator SMI1